MIRLRVKGLMLERLLDRALEKGAQFKSVVREGPRTISVDTDERGFKALTELCERFSIQYEVVEMRGAEAFRRLAKRRWTLLPGILLCAILLFLYTQRIWRIDVLFAGDRPVEFSEADVLGMLAAMDVVPGMEKRGLDTDVLMLDLSAKSEEFSFVGARVKGVRLLVEVAPSLKAPEIYDPDYARDLVAKADGIVVSVTAQVGVAAVKPGDIVRRGDVLIRGEERVTREASRGIAARGEVIARTWATAELEADTHTVVRALTGREGTGSVLSLLQWSIPLQEAAPLSPVEVETEYLPVGGMFLPLMIVRTTEREYEERAVPKDEAALRELLREQAFALTDAEIAGYGEEVRQIVDKWIDYSMIEEGRLRA
ncbi:MAG: sporulation protein YqfD, partial [Clostridiales bacterium]|nr:sporulation protein YqfD [Clostridiales bacterium]